MKKHIALIGALLGATLFAAENDALLTFGTPGTDRYADGTVVMNGECYALVWTKDGTTFGGFTAECKPVSETDKLVLVAPLAKSGRCPTTVLELDAAAASQYDGGTFGLYLLDTRVRATDGKVSLAPFKDGAPQLVNSLGAAADAEEAADASSGKAASLKASSAVKLGSVGFYTEIEVPTITSIHVENATVTLTVDKMNPTADYFVVPLVKPGEPAPALDAKPTNDTFTFPKPDGATLFKVLGKRKF